MIVSGHIISGVNFLGKQNLGSIATEGFHFDYRFGQTIVNDGTYNRIQALADLSSNQLTAIAPNPQSRPILVSDGIIGLTGATRFLQAPFRQIINKFHLGTAFMTYSVFSFNNPTNTNAGTINAYATQSSSKPGNRLGIVTSSDQLNGAIFNDTGTSLGAGTRAMNEDSTFRLGVFLYYGSGGSNNRKIILADQVTTATFNPTFGIDSCDGLKLFEIPGGAASMVKFKKTGGYVLEGKSVVQIDAFMTTFYTTLKSDSEYSALTTP